MGMIENEIDKNIGVYNIVKVDVVVAEGIHCALVKKFCTKDQYAFPFWEHLKDKFSVRDTEGWQWIKEFVSGKRTYLVLEQADEKAVYKFDDGNAIVSMLGECFGFTFYLTDEEISYLLCFNDHDYLIACGAAIDWLKSYIK